MEIKLNEITINGQFNNVKWSYDSTNGPYVYMRGIEVDLGTGRGYELLTDGLTDTGANSFYLPMDGNSPIGKDQSGNGNDWTSVNFGGSVELDSPQVSGKTYSEHNSRCNSGRSWCIWK